MSKEFSDRIVDINNETNMKTTKSAPSPLYSMLEGMPSIWSHTKFINFINIE